MPRKEKSRDSFSVCETLKMLIEKYGCSAEVVGIGYADFEEKRKDFIAIINLSGKKEDIVEFQHFIKNEHGKIEEFPVVFFLRETIH